ncbi:unnamed protein product [Penicillium bialowiezense]
MNVDRPPIDTELDSLGSFISEIPDSQEQAVAPQSEQDAPRPRIDTHAAQPTRADQPAVPQWSYAALHSRPMEIHPPKPPVSSEPFTTHITPTLSMLTERLKPARTYNPEWQTRSLDPLERGFWFLHLDCERDGLGEADLALPVWTSSVFATFWSFLSDFIGRDGRAGWGVWCILEQDGDLRSGLVTLKIYGWGEIAMHTYLLLFLASERRIRGMGAQWRDSQEEVIVQMP